MSAGRLSARGARRALAAAIVCTLGLAAPAPAGAAPQPVGAVIAGGESVQVGPFSVGDRFSLYVTGRGCGTNDPDFTLTYLSGSPTDRLSHVYTVTGTDASCTLGARPAGAAARLNVNVPGLVEIAVEVGDLTAPLERGGVPVGCGPPAVPERLALATGRIDVAIHPAVFGRVALAGAGADSDAEIFAGAPQTCPALQAPNGRELTADIGRYILDADQPSVGAAQLDIIDAAVDDPGPGLAGVLSLHMSGDAALAVDAATGSARIGAATGLTAGSLSFVPLAPCAGASAQNGSLSGSLTIDDPVLGPQRILGAAADSAYTGEGTAVPGGCNGPGSRPLEPELISTCDSADAGCSVTGTGATATFFDESSAGTQTVTAETLDFGDGSAPVALSLGAALQHDYGAAGTYLATLTITDAAGDSAATVADVVIDPSTPAPA